MKIFISLLLTCIVGCFTGSGQLETRAFAVSNFDSIEIDRGIELDVVRGDAFAVSVTADDNDWQILNVSQADATLRIELPSDTLLSNVTVHATVTMPVLASLHASGAAKATFSGFDATTLALHASGASTISGDGTASALTVEGSGASHIELESLRASTAQISLSGGSDGTMTVDGELDYHLSGGSHLVYFGNPTVGSNETSGGSSVDRR